MGQLYIIYVRVGQSLKPLSKLPESLPKVYYPSIVKIEFPHFYEKIYIQYPSLNRYFKNYLSGQIA